MSWTSVRELLNDLGIDKEPLDLKGIEHEIRARLGRVHPDATGGVAETRQQNEEFLRLRDALIFVKAARDHLSAPAVRPSSAETSTVQQTRLTLSLEQETEAVEKRVSNSVKKAYAIPRLTSLALWTIASAVLAFSQALDRHPLYLAATRGLFETYRNSRLANLKKEISELEGLVNGFRLASNWDNDPSLVLITVLDYLRATSPSAVLTLENGESWRVRLLLDENIGDLAQRYGLDVVGAPLFDLVVPSAEDPFRRCVVVLETVFVEAVRSRHDVTDSSSGEAAASSSSSLPTVIGVSHYLFDEVSGSEDVSLLNTCTRPRTTAFSNTPDAVAVQTGLRVLDASLSGDAAIKTSSDKSARILAQLDALTTSTRQRFEKVDADARSDVNNTILRLLAPLWLLLSATFLAVWFRERSDLRWMEYVTTEDGLTQVAKSLVDVAAGGKVSSAQLSKIVRSKDLPRGSSLLFGRYLNTPKFSETVDMVAKQLIARGAISRIDVPDVQRWYEIAPEILHRYSSSAQVG